jgi:hypothetical protein
MAAWTDTQTNRFRAAVSGAPMTHLASEYGTNWFEKYLKKIIPGPFLEGACSWWLKQRFTAGRLSKQNKITDLPQTHFFSFSHLKEAEKSP